MRFAPNCTVRVGFWCRRDGAGVRDCVGQCVRAESARRDRRLHAQRFHQLREDQAGRWLRVGLFAVRLEARRLHLRSQARRHPRRRQVGDRARRIRAGAGGCVPGPAARALRPGLSAAQLHHRRRGQAHALPMRGVPSDARRRQAAGRLSLRHVLEQQVRQASPHHALRQQHRGRRAQIRHRLDPGAVGRRRQLPRRAGPRAGPARAAPQSGRGRSRCTARRARRRSDARKAISAKCAEQATCRRRPHRADHVRDLVRIGHRQRTGFADADERGAPRPRRESWPAPDGSPAMRRRTARAGSCG